MHDMLGINKGFSPKFLRRYADLIDGHQSGGVALHRRREDIRLPQRLRTILNLFIRLSMTGRSFLRKLNGTHYS